MKPQHIPLVILLGLPITQPVIADPVKSIDIRYQSTQTMEDLHAVGALIQERLRQAPDSFDLNWQLARVLFASGETVNRKVDQIGFFVQCGERAKRIIETFPQRTKGYYFKTLCQSKYGQLDGLQSSLSTITPFKENMETAARLDPRIESGGPHRALKRFFQDLPVLLGGRLRYSSSASQIGGSIWARLLGKPFVLAKALLWK